MEIKLKTLNTEERHGPGFSADEDVRDPPPQWEQDQETLELTFRLSRSSRVDDRLGAFLTSTHRDSSLARLRACRQNMRRAWWRTRRSSELTDHSPVFIYSEVKHTQMLDVHLTKRTPQKAGLAR